MTITIKRHHLVLLILVSVLIAFWVWSRSQDEADWLAREYGITNAFSAQAMTPSGPVQATLVPVTLGNGQRAHLIVPEDRSSNGLYFQDETGVHRVVSGDRTLRREQFVRSRPAVIRHRVEEVREPVVTERVVREPVVTERVVREPEEKKRSWEKEVLIVAGSSGAGAAIGAAAGGGKGAAIGAISGGVAGLVYDLATRK